MNKDYRQEEITIIAKGICFGSAIGLIIGMFMGHPSLVMTLGAVSGVVLGEIYRIIIFFKDKKEMKLSRDISEKEKLN